MLIARGRLKHQYPHSWRSKKPIIFRNTPQWFIAMDKDIDRPGDYAARARHAGDPRHALGAAAGREPHHRHDRVAPRLGDLAPARLGRADHGVHQGERRRLGRDARGRRGQHAHRRGLRGRRRRRLVQGRRARALPRRAAPTTAGRRSTTFSTSGSIPARRTPSCSRTRCISRRSPASSASATAGRTR